MTNTHLAFVEHAQTATESLAILDRVIAYWHNKHRVRFCKRYFDFMAINAHVSNCGDLKIEPSIDSKSR